MENREEKKLTVLFLARWYPNRYDPMPGLFIQRHAEAANRDCNVGVVYTHVIENDSVNKVYDLDVNVINDVPTAKVYYQNPKGNIPLITQLIKAFRFYKANYLGIKEIRSQLGDFDLVHVHILTRLGLIALYYKWFQNKPFVITEHWSRYLELTDAFQGRIRKAVTKIVVRNAAVVTTVTRNLADAMINHGLKNKNYHVLANVVAEPFFSPEVLAKKTDKRVITHVSCFEDKSKNVSGLLRVIQSLATNRNDFVFRMIGDGMDFTELKKYAADLGLTESHVLFTGLLESEKLVQEMAAADLLVIFSNYENFPVVINESLTLGIPVFATSVGGIPEYVNKSNGRLLTAGDEKELKKLLNRYLDNQITFDNQKIRAQSYQMFSPETIGKDLLQIYTQALVK